MNATLQSAYHFRRTAIDARVPPGWRALDHAVARWTIAHGGSLELALVAGWASFADGQGDSALPLTGADAGRHGMLPLLAADIATLRSDALVGAAGAVDTPFVIDRGHFYLRRNFLHEVALAQQVRARRAAAAPAEDSTPGTKSSVDLDTLFAGVGGPDVEAQHEAVVRVRGKRLFVLTGGPGTGKTTTVLRMLLRLAKDRADCSQADPVIRMSAPTGKAAQRLSEALRAGAAQLGGGIWQVFLDRVLSAESGTLHRLLGSRGQGRFIHHAGNPIAADIVVVDEASMADLTLLRLLLDALREDTVLILVGDADQLTSVGTGSVLLDLVTAMQTDGGHDLVRLRHSFRADPGLVPINEAIRTGNTRAFDEAWQQAGPRAIRREVNSAATLRGALRRWCDALHSDLNAAGVFAAVPEDRVLAALDALRTRQLLCALREGEFGALQVNAVLERMLRAGSDTEAAWYPGRRVMIVRNDYASGLFNGDVGLCLRDERGQLGVWFEQTVADAGQSVRRAVRFAPGSVAEHQGAFAATIHKSQGSEYDHVAVLLPPDAGHRILSRQLLYTGVSRARRSVELWGTDAVIHAAIATPVQRAGCLAARIGAGT